MQPHPVQPLKLEDIDNMSNGELVERMDDLLIARDKEIYPPDMFTAPFPRTDPTVAEFAATITVSGMSSERARRAIYAAFEFLLQRTFIMVAMGAANRLVYDSRMFQQIGWRSPSVQIANAALNESTILASRAAFERFIDLLHVVENGVRIDARRSKFKKMMKFLFSSSRWRYFAPSLILVRRFDRGFRTAAAHGGSTLPRVLLAMNDPDPDEGQRVLDLLNLLLNMWRPMIDILNGKAVNYAYGELDVDGWLKAWVSGNVELIDTELRRLEALLAET